MKIIVLLITLVSAISAENVLEYVDVGFSMGYADNQASLYEKDNNGALSGGDFISSETLLSMNVTSHASWKNVVHYGLSFDYNFTPISSFSSSNMTEEDEEDMKDASGNFSYLMLLGDIRSPYFLKVSLGLKLGYESGSMVINDAVFNYEDPDKSYSRFVLGPSIQTDYSKLGFQFSSMVLLDMSSEDEQIFSLHSTIGWKLTSIPIEVFVKHSVLSYDHFIDSEKYDSYNTLRTSETKIALGVKYYIF